MDEVRNGFFEGCDVGVGGEWARQWRVPGEDLVREIRGVVPRGRGGAVAR